MKKLLIVLCIFMHAGIATAQQAPVIQSWAFSDITGTTAVITMQFIPNSSSTIAWVQYGPSAAVSQSDTIGTFSGFSPITITDTLDSLPCNAYCYCEVRAQNASGMDFSTQLSFFVPSCLSTMVQNILAPESHITIAPMPITESATISAPESINAPFFIYDASGRLAATIPITNGHGTIEKGLPPGMYYYECNGQPGKLVVAE